MKLTKSQMHKAIVNNMKEVREIATTLKLNDTEKFQLASRMAKWFLGDINKYFDRMRNNLYGVPKQETERIYNMTNVLLKKMKSY